MTNWSIQNLDRHLPSQVWETVMNHNVVSFSVLGILIVSFSYPLIHQIYLKYCQRYRNNLNRDQQLVVVQHTIEAITLSVLFAPFTYVILSANFEEQDFETFKTKLVAISAFMVVINGMYLIEIASRFASLRPLVAAHHLCATGASLLTIFFLTTATVRASTLLVYFITFEAITFVGLIMYRLAPTHSLTRPIIVAGMLIFGLSRPLQFVWIIGGLWVNWDDLVVWQAVIQILFTCVFTVLQVYSLTIHYTLYKKCGTHIGATGDTDKGTKGIAVVAEEEEEDLEATSKDFEEDGDSSVEVVAEALEGQISTSTNRILVDESGEFDV